MERHGATAGPGATARAMEPYVEAGLTTFDMADHYGSAEVIAGRFRRDMVGDRSVELLTKWVPEPGPLDAEAVRAAVERALDRLSAEPSTSSSTTPGATPIRAGSTTCSCSGNSGRKG